MNQTAIRDISLLQMYNNLIASKRELDDLRHSIRNTIDSIRNYDNVLRHIQSRRKIKNQHLQAAPQNISPPLSQNPQSAATNNKVCQICLRHFQRSSDLTHHLHQHQTSHINCCSHCDRPIAQPQQIHSMHFCPEKATPCQFCNLSIKMKDLDDHMKICSFKECYKCRKYIYTRAYGYHLQCCQGVNKLTNAPYKRIRYDRIERPIVLPLSLVTQYD